MFRTIFVFGSNTEGKHGKGAAYTAWKKHGAIYGQATGLQGNSYAIVTKDLANGKRSIALADIERQVNEFLNFARSNEEFHFFVTPIGCGLAGYTAYEIAPFFKHAPVNVELPLEFRRMLNNFLDR